MINYSKIITPSAHADQNGILNWLSEIKNKPKKVYLIHGEAGSADALRLKIKDTLGWNVIIPQLYDIEIITI
jgi:metallo-beta-lactamase family protein